MSFNREHVPNVDLLWQVAKAEARELFHDHSELAELQQVLGVGIDNLDNAKDAEQIIWVKLLDGRKVALSISVINPDFIPKGGKLEDLANNRVATVYDLDGNPIQLMFPEEITYDLGAFSVGQQRPAMTLELVIDLEDPDAEIESRFFLSAATNVAQMSYKTADKIIGENGEFAPGQEAAVFVRIADYLLARSKGEGAVTKLKQKYSRNTNGKNSPAERIVKVLMTEYNRLAALHTMENLIPALYTNFINGLNDAIEQTEASREYPSISTVAGDEANARATAPGRSLQDLINAINICSWLRGQPPRFDTEYLEAVAGRINAFKADMRESETKQKLTLNIRSLEIKLGYQANYNLDEMNSAQMQDVYNHLNSIYLWRDDLWYKFRTLVYLAEEFNPSQVDKLDVEMFNKILADENGPELLKRENRKVNGRGKAGSKDTRKKAQNLAILDFLGEEHEKIKTLSNDDLYQELNNRKSVYSRLQRECSSRGIELGHEDYFELHRMPLYQRIEYLEEVLAVEKNRIN